MIAAGLLAATMLDEGTGNQHLDVALDRLRGDARLSLDSRHLQAWMGLDAVEDRLLTGIERGGTRITRITLIIVFC